MTMAMRKTETTDAPRERHTGQHDQCRLCRLVRAAADHMKGDELNSYIDYLSGLAPDPRD
jgi:hypothetical protein